MARRSVFRVFISTLRKQWKEELPHIQPMKESLGWIMSKASTFHAGYSDKLGLHIFVNFQHSSKAWQVGQFTINLILSKEIGVPTGNGMFIPADGVSFTEGSYRLGHVLGKRFDKWWHLKHDDAQILGEEWRPSSYEDEVTVLKEAVADVTGDVCRALVMLGL
ncbi:MAG: hypothetical protein U0796_15725 [Gemmatales bacterium]